MHSTAKNNFFLLAVHFLFVFNIIWKKCFIIMPYVWVLMSSSCCPFYIWQILSSVDSKKLKDNYSITSLSELFVCSDSGKSWIGTHIFRQERICIEESSCKRPAMGGPSSSQVTKSTNCETEICWKPDIADSRDLSGFWTLSINLDRNICFIFLFILCEVIFQLVSFYHNIYKHISLNL